MTPRTVPVFWSLLALMFWLLLLSGTWLTWWTIKAKTLGIAGIVVIVDIVLEIVFSWWTPRRAPPA